MSEIRRAVRTHRDVKPAFLLASLALFLPHEASFPHISWFLLQQRGSGRHRQATLHTLSYYLGEDGTYYLRDNLVETLNFAAKWDKASRSWSDWARLDAFPTSHAKWHREAQIRGLEDIRIRGNCFTATTQEYSYNETNRIVHGRYPELWFAPVLPLEGKHTARRTGYPSQRPTSYTSGIP